MRCRYCKQKLNLFKSLAGSSFCSPEHQKLYEEAEASKGFERLLQFVEKDGKPATAAKAPAVVSPVPPAPEATPVLPASPPPVPQTIAAKVPELAPEPPLASFLLERKAPVASASASANPSFEILEQGFPAGPPALPSSKFKLDAADFESLAEEPPPPLASWSNQELAAMEAPGGPIDVPNAGPVRPRAIEPTLLPPQSH